MMDRYMNGISNDEEKHSKLFAWEKIENDLIAAEKSLVILNFFSAVSFLEKTQMF